MKIIRESSENEMILEFLKGELSSKRFSQNLFDILNELNINKDIITKGDINSKEQNIIRKQIIYIFRGYPNKELFNNFPKIEMKNYAFERMGMLEHSSGVIFYDKTIDTSLEAKTSHLKSDLFLCNKHHPHMPEDYDSFGVSVFLPVHKRRTPKKHPPYSELSVYDITQ